MKISITENDLKSLISESIKKYINEYLISDSNKYIPEDIIDKINMISKEYNLGANLDPKEISVYDDSKRYLGRGMGFIIPDDIEGSECEEKIKKLGFYDAGLRKSGRGYVYSPTIIKDGGYL